MYFAKMEFVPNVEMAEKAQHDAQAAISSAARYCGITLDGTVDSIRDIDTILDRILRLVSAPEFPKETTESFERIYGSYVGEVLRNALGATWGKERIYSNWVPAMCVGPNEIVFNPLRWVHERIAEKPGRDLWTYYEILVRSVQAGEEKGIDDVHSAERDKSSTLPDKLYTLRHDQDYFDTGISADGRQVLAEWDSTTPMAIFFDGAGNLLGCEVRSYWTPESDAIVEQAAQAWKDEIGFRPRPIRIHRFSLPEQEVGLEDRPDTYEMFLKAPELEEPDEEERKAMFEIIREWDEEGNFVLYWGNDLWLDADGEVTSP